MVGGQLHDEGGGLSGKGLELFENHTGNHHRRNADEEGRHRHQRGIAEHRPGKQADDRHFRAAGDEARGHDGDFPVIFLLNGAGRQNARHAAAGGHQHGDDGFTGQAELAQEPVHNEGHPGHIAHVFQNGQEHGKHQNLGHKAQHRADTRQNAVHHQPVEPAADPQSRQNGIQKRRNPLPEQHVVGPVRADGADGEGEAAHGDGVHGEHDQSKNRQGQHPVCHNAVDSVRE